MRLGPVRERPECGAFGAGHRVVDAEFVALEGVEPRHRRRTGGDRPGDPRRTESPEIRSRVARRDGGNAGRALAVPVASLVAHVGGV
jgi:hypothetical protein